MFLSITGAPACFASSPVTAGFEPTGLTSLRYQNSELLARGTPEIRTVRFASPAGAASVEGSLAHQTHYERDGHRTGMRFDWGSVSVEYRPLPAALEMVITVINASRRPLERLSLEALVLRFASTPEPYDGVTPLLATNLGAPTAIALRTGAGAFVLCNEDVRRPLLVGFPWALDRPANRTFPLRIDTGRDAMYPDSLPLIVRPIPPGGRDVYRLSLRFGPEPAPPLTALPQALAGDVLARFAAADPFRLRWPDRRPIGSLIIATANTGWRTNPRGWLLDPKLDVTSFAGRAEFRRRLLSWADRSIAILKKMQAQGMVTWDIEGEQFAHPTTYIGDPRLVDRLAPEMGAVADEYFARFRQAGLRVGVTIRPQHAVVTGGGAVEQKSAADAAAVLIEKIDYARRRWGATLFYIDSNGDAVFPLPFEVLRRVAEAEPDVLLMPEHKNTAYYSIAAPYAELRGGVSGTPPTIRAVYPRAFSVINTADGAVEQHRRELARAVSAGDILMFRAWFDDPANALIENLMRGRAATDKKEEEPPLRSKQ